MEIYTGSQATELKDVSGPTFLVPSPINMPRMRAPACLQFLTPFGVKLQAVVPRFGIATLMLVATLGAQTRAYVASAGTVPNVSVRSIASGPAIGAIPSGPHVIQPLGALGGAFAGNALSRPLGGGIVVNGPGGAKTNPSRGRRSTIPAGSAVFASYVPSYIEVPAEAPAEAAPPVIINQYFSAPPLPPRIPLPPAIGAAASQEGSGDLLSPAEDYYLIAYRNRSMYAALTWWLEGNTLHYVTTQNTHNQASLDLIDVDKTIKLNQDRNVPFSIPGR